MSLNKALMINEFIKTVTKTHSKHNSTPMNQSIHNETQQYDIHNSSPAIHKCIGLFRLREQHIWNLTDLYSRSLIFICEFIVISNSLIDDEMRFFTDMFNSLF